MNVSISRLGRALLPGLLVATLIAPVAFAQAPAPLFPEPAGPPPAPTAAPTETPADRRTETPPAATAPGPAIGGGPRYRGLRTETLGAVDPDSVGLRGPKEGGFESDLWRDTPRALVMALLARLPDAPRLPALRALQIRLLTSRAAAPTGTGDAGALLVARVAKLAAMGASADAGALARATPLRRDNETLVRAAVEAAFLTNDLAGACRDVRDDGPGFADPFWQKAQAFCFALNGERRAARFNLDLLQEFDPQPDPAYDTLIAALLGEADEDEAVISLASPSPLHVALLRAARKTVPAQAATTKRLDVLAALVRSPNADLATRVAALERAEAAGVLPLPLRRALYAELPVSDEELARPLSASEGLFDLRARGLLYRAARDAGEAAIRAEIIAEALSRAAEFGRYADTARLFADQLARVPVSIEFRWFGLAALRAAIAADDIALARGWLGLLREESRVDAVIEDGLARLAPLLRLLPTADPAVVVDAGVGSGVGPRGAVESDSGADAVMVTPVAVPEAPLAVTDARTALVLEAAGVPVQMPAWRDQIGDPGPIARPRPPLAVRRALAEAAEAGRVGETVLLTLTALGAVPLEAVEADVLADAITALTRIGEGAVARGVAVEALLARWAGGDGA